MTRSGLGSGGRRRVAGILAAIAAAVLVAGPGIAAPVGPATASPVGPATPGPGGSVVGGTAAGSPDAGGSGPGWAGVGSPGWEAIEGSNWTGVGDPPVEATASGGTLHGNHVTVGPQVVGDGRVVVESAALLTGGHVAIHRDDGGERGELLGTAPLGAGTHTAVQVPIDAGALPAGENVTLRATVYGDDGDGEFDDDDRPLTAFGSVAEDTFAARVGDGTVRVVAADLRLRRSNGSVTLDRVDLDRPGYVVVHGDRGLTLGEAVGRTALDAGTHRNVTVDLDPALFAEDGERLDLRAVAYVDDGDGEFGGGDHPVRIGTAPVSGRLSVLTVAGNGSTATTALVNTPEPTTSVSTPATTTAGPATSAGSAGSTGSDDGSDGGNSGSGGLPLPGFGASLAVVGALLGVGYLAVRRR